MPAHGYEIMDHTADKAVRAWSDSLESLFAILADAMFAIFLDRNSVAPVSTESIEVRAGDLQNLVVRWLSELLYMHEVDGKLILDTQVTEVSEGDDCCVRATICTAPIDSGETYLGGAVKAVTYHALRVDHTPTGWEAFVLFDV